MKVQKDSRQYLSWLYPSRYLFFCTCVRESPPPTPRGAYLLWRPECTQERKAWKAKCHCHGHLTQLSLDSFFIFVRICDPTTQSHSQAEPEDPVCSPYLSLLCFQLVSALLPGLSPPYCTSPYFTFFTSVHLLISHLSPVPPIFPSVCLCYLDFLRTLMFHPYLLCSTRVVFKISSLYSVSSESTLLLSVLSVLI